MFRAPRIDRPRRPERRASAARRGYDRAEQRVAQAYLVKHPICQAPGCNEPATDVDHIVPLRQGGARLETNNLQSLCHSCHSRKTRRGG